MKTFLSPISNQIREGTCVAILGGTIIGLIIGIFIVTLENANLIFPNILTRFYLVVFLTTLAALISTLIFLPLELAMGLGAKISSRLSRINLKRFYVSSYLIGVVFLSGYLWIGFNVVRNISSTKGIILTLVLFIFSFILFIISIKLSSIQTSIQRKGVNSIGLIFVVTIYAVFCSLSYKHLSDGFLTNTSSEIDDKHLSFYLDINSDLTPAGFNVILVSIDTLRPDHLSSYGYFRQTSPNIDELATEGIIFRNARSQSPWTLPSHATMLTALYPSSNGVMFWDNSRFLNKSRVADKLSDSHLTLTEILNAVGYSTAAFTSSVWVSPNFGLDQGFNKFEMDIETHTAKIIVDRAINWAGHQKSNPYFIFLHFNDVHEYISPPEYDELYQDDDYNGDVKGDSSLKTKIMGNLYENLKPNDLEYVIAKYDGAIKYVDSELGRFFSWLRETEQYDNTLIIITSDHGEEFLEHGGTGHGFTLYEEQLRVPLIIKPPSKELRRAENESYTNVGIIDITPTVLDYLNLPLISTFEGRSLRPLNDNEIKTSTTYIAEAAIFHNMYATVQGGHKYIGNRFIPAKLLSPSLWFVTIRSFFKFKKDELYSIGNDPYEKDNLFEQEQEIASVMRHDLLEHIKKSNAGQQIEINKETMEQLRSLGYIQ